MGVRNVAEGLHIIPGLVNIYLLEIADGLAVIDTGFPGSAGKILDAVRAIGRVPADVRHILLTHAHPDHIGSTAALKQKTGAKVWAHAVDAPIIEAGKGFRHTDACPGLRNRILASVLRRFMKDLEPVTVDHLLSDGDIIPFAPALTVIHVPGHCAGQIAFHLKRSGGILITADTCVHRRGRIRLPVAAEDLDEAHRSLVKLAGFDFDRLCFMHGSPILAGADTKFRAWASGGALER